MTKTTFRARARYTCTCC